MRRSAQATEERPDGYAFRLPRDAALFRKAAEWIGLERRCCPSVAFALEWDADDGIWLRCTGGPGVKELVALEILGK